MRTVEEVGLWLKRLGDTLHLLLLNTLGKITPTIHQAVIDVPREYMRSGGRLWEGLEESIERMQQRARVLCRCHAGAAATQPTTGWFWLCRAHRPDLKWLCDLSSPGPPTHPLLRS